MPEAAVPRCTVAELRSLLADPSRTGWLVHATDHAGFQDGHIPGALARPHDAQLRQLGRTSRVVVYGEHEHVATAPALTAALRRHGVEAAWFAGGLAAWTAAGLPIEGCG